MSDVYDEQELDVDSVDEFLEHFGVKGMKWGVRKAVDSPVGRVVTAPSRAGLAVGGAVAKQGVKNVKAIGGAIGRANERQKVRDEAYVNKHGELGATLRVGARHIGAMMVVNHVANMAVKDLRGQSGKQANVRLAQSIINGTLLVSEVARFARNDAAAKRINVREGRDKNAYVSKEKKRNRGR